MMKQTNSVMTISGKYVESNWVFAESPSSSRQATTLQTAENSPQFPATSASHRAFASPVV